MRKILIWRKVIEGDGVDIFFSTDYKDLTNRLKTLYSGSCPNWGNKLWFQGLYTEVSSPENDIRFRTTETADEINSNYDLIIYPMANFFGEEYVSGMESLAKEFLHIKIPVYIIACGVQAKSYDMLDSLIEKIGTPASKFIEAIYRTGGEFALRGNFTKEFFSRLGFPSAVATGCPSLFQMGESFTVNNKKVAESALKPIVNGSLRNFEKIMKSVPQSIYMDQDCYCNCLYQPNYLDNFSLRSQILFAYNYSPYQAELLGAGRIKMIADMNDWYHYIKDEGFNYSLGNRIHGNIMTILTGSPATVIALDTRTLEMAEFFDIPHISFDPKKQYDKNDLLHLYHNADFTKFNQRYRDRYKKFQDFLVDHKIVSKVNAENKFFAKPAKRDFDLYQPNQAAFQEQAKLLKRRTPIMHLGTHLIRLKNKLR